MTYRTPTLFRQRPFRNPPKQLSTVVGRVYWEKENELNAALKIGLTGYGKEYTPTFDRLMDFLYKCDAITTILENQKPIRVDDKGNIIGYTIGHCILLVDIHPMHKDELFNILKHEN